MWTLIGQDKILNQIRISLINHNLSHAYLLIGPQHIGKMSLALDLVAAVNCKNLFNIDCEPCDTCESCIKIRRKNYADLLITEVGDDEQVPTRISINQIRAINDFLSFTQVEGKYKTVIINSIETLSDGQKESANALLKILEEPPQNTILILLCHNENAILSTIRSRCRVLNLLPMSVNDLSDYLQVHRSVEYSYAKYLSSLARGRPGWAFNALHDASIIQHRNDELDIINDLMHASLPDLFLYANNLSTEFSNNRESVKEKLYLWQSWCQDILLIKQNVLNRIQNSEHYHHLTQLAQHINLYQIFILLNKIQDTLYVLNFNVNSRLALESMMLAVPIIK